MKRLPEDNEVNTRDEQERCVCPACGTSNTLNALVGHEYRCGQCTLELAYLDFTPNGVIRGIFGWLRTEGEIIEGRYRVKSVLGKGGFGTTYLVEDLRLNGKRRALKEVPELLFDEYETKLLSRLNHPSIPDIIDRSVVDKMVYLVLEFGGNRTLGGERARNQGRIPQAMLFPWMRQLCEVLMYLHSQDPPIIHRDLKPDNILLDETGRIMLIDFGIAKESEPTAMTRTLGRAASSGFSPPEQAMGTGTDQRSDIYALGATFYALLTGEKPPAAHERVAGKEIVPPSQIVPEVLPRLDDIILKALNLNVNHRQQTVKEFSLALEAVDAGVQIPTRATGYAERTTLLGNKVGATGSHSTSIKLPSEPIGLDHPVKMAPERSTRPVSRKNMIFLITGLVITIGSVTGGYWLWSDSKPDNGEMASSESNSKDGSMVVAPSERPINKDKPNTDGTATTPASPGSSTEATQPTRVTADAAFTAKLGEKRGGSKNRPDPEPGPSPINPTVQIKQPPIKVLPPSKPKQNTANWLEESTIERIQ